MMASLANFGGLTLADSVGIVWLALLLRFYHFHTAKYPKTEYASHSFNSVQYPSRCRMFLTDVSPINRGRAL